MILEKELATFDRLRESLLGSEGKWAVVHGDRLPGIFDEYLPALQAGYHVCGMEDFLVKMIHPFGEPVLVTRLAVDPCQL